MQTATDLEARALAQCYALLIRKAQERRARLAQEAAAQTTAVQQMADDGKDVSDDEDTAA